ncbi:MAG: helix-turn-helix domain-containing protein [Sphingomonas sp.]
MNRQKFARSTPHHPQPFPTPTHQRYHPQMPALESRLRSIRAHDDGVDSWRMADIAPPPLLAGLIDGYSDYAERTGSFTTRRELPHAQGVMIVNLGAPIGITGGDGREIALLAGEAFVAGPHLRPALSRSSGSQAGLHIFLPLASLRRLVGVPMDRLIDQVVPLDALLGPAATGLCAALLDAPDMAGRIALLDAALLSRFAAAPALAGAQRHALGLLRDRPDLDVAEVARTIGWSRKHLANRVQDAVGVGPRCWRRLLRFERLVAGLAEAPAAGLAGLAFDAGYCDQSHMIREFREFAGLTPSDYLARNLADGGGLVEA